MKFFVIAALFALLLLLVYSKIYPYLQVIKKLLGTAKTFTATNARTSSSPRAAEKTDGKLVRCVSCGTWIPAARAIGNRTGSSVYCSTACVEKEAQAKERKFAG